MNDIAQPTPGTRLVAHAAVGAVGGAIGHAVAKKFGAAGVAYVLLVLASLVLLAYAHMRLDAPVATIMASNGLQF